MTSTFFLLSPPSLLASLLAVYPFPGSSLTPHSSSGGQILPGEALSSPAQVAPRSPGLCFLLSPPAHSSPRPCPAYPITVPFTFVHRGWASKTSSPLPAHPGAQGPPGRMRSGTDKPHKWAHLCPECPWPRRVHASPLSSTAAVPLLRVSLSAPVT